MAYLKKTAQVTYTAGVPGVPGVPGSPASPAWTENRCSPEGASSGGSGQNTTVVCWALPYTYEDAQGRVYLVTPGCRTITSSGGSGGGSTGVSYNPNPPSCFVYHPATAATPATPATPPTPGGISINNQAGWNSVAWTTEPIAVGQGFECRPIAGSRGVILALTTDSGTVPNIPDIPHALFLDNSGAYVLEYGVVVATLPRSYGMVRIERNDLGQIVFATSASTSRISQLSSIHPIYVAVMLYQADDGITDFRFYDAVTTSQSASVVIAQASQLIAAPDGAASVLIEQDSEVSLFDASTASNNRRVEIYQSCETYFNATVQNTLNIVLPPLSVLMSDYDYSELRIDLPALSMESGEEFLTPSARNELLIVLPSLQVLMYALEGDVGQLEIVLPPLSMIQSEGEYGHLNIELPPLSALMFERTDEVLNAQELLVGFSWSSIVSPDEVVEVVTYDLSAISTGTISSTSSALLTILKTVVDTAIATATSNCSINILKSIVVYAVVSDSTSSRTEGVGAVQSEQVWVLNLDNGATSQYENYGFNSYLSVGGVDYGVDEHGMYELTGDTDEGDIIDAQIRLALSRLGSVKEKSNYSTYLAVGSGDVMLLKVIVDGGTEYIYEARSSSAHVETHRVDMGRGLKGTHWQFTLMNKDGADFDLHDIEFRPLAGNRRI